MRRKTVVAAVLVLGVAGCRSSSRPIYEYEPPVTITSTDRPVPPAAPTNTTAPPRAPVWFKGEAR